MTIAYKNRRKHSKRPNREQLCTPRSKRAKALEAARREKSEQKKARSVETVPGPSSYSKEVLSG